MIRPLVAIPAVALASLTASPALAQQKPQAPARPAPAAAQEQGQAAPTPPPPAPSTGGRLTPAEREALRQEIKQELSAEFEQQLQTAREEMRDEVRAAVTSAGAATEWDEEWEEVRPKLDFLELDGYFRTRMDLFYNFDLNTGPDAGGFHFFPVDPSKPSANTVAGANMRLRVDPTFNVSEEIRLRAQMDVFDNLVYGSTNGGGFALLPDGTGVGNQRYPYNFQTQNQASPRFGWNSIADSIQVKRAWAEVRTPIGELRFGRQPNNFGMGMLFNDGNCLDCDNGDNVDRIMFATRVANHVIAPAIDFGSEGPTSANPFFDYPNPQPFDRSQRDDSRDYVLTILRRDSDEEMRKMRVAGRDTFINYGLYFAYRTQSWDTPALDVPGPGNGNAGGGAPVDGTTEPPNGDLWIPRDAWAVIPDVWFRLIHKSLRVELEFATVQGSLGNRSFQTTAGAAEGPTEDQSIDLAQYGAVLQTELKLIDDKLGLGLEVGYASGDQAPGFGNFPGRQDPTSGQFPRRGDWEGLQFNCSQPACSDDAIRNFRFSPDYHVDLILFREILGGVTDATYVKPSVNYDVTEGLGLNLAIIYSQANASGTTPTGDKPLGVEIDASVNYLSDDGFVASLAYGVLFPLSGLDQLRDPTDPARGTIGAETAQAVRGFFGVVY